MIDREVEGDDFAVQIDTGKQSVRGVVAHLDSGRDVLAIKPTGVEPLDAKGSHATAELPEVTIAKPVPITDFSAIAADAGLVDEAHRRIEILLDVARAEAAAQARDIRRGDPEAVRRVVRAADALGIALLIPGLALEDPAAGQARVPVPEVGAHGRAVEVRVRVAVGDYESDVRLGEHVCRRPPDKEIRLAYVPEFRLPYRQCAEVEAPGAAAELAAVLDVDRLPRAAETDSSGKERPGILTEAAAEAAATSTSPAAATAAASAADAAELEDVGVLQEEVALLGEEQPEPGEVDLPVVDLGRGEVGVDRKRCIEQRRDLVEDIERGLPIEPRSAPSIEVVVFDDAQRRHDIQPAALLQAFETRDRARDARVELAVARDPAQGLVIALNRALEVHSPGVVGGIERQRLEGNRHFRGPAAVVARRCALPDPFPVRLDIGCVLIERIPAHAVGVDLEAITAAPVEIRVEYDREPVLVPEPLALAQDLRRDPFRVAVIEPCGNVQGVVVVGEAYLRRLGRFGVFDGIELMQVFDQCRPRPDLVVEHAVDLRFRVDADDRGGLVAVRFLIGVLCPDAGRDGDHADDRDERRYATAQLKSPPAFQEIAATRRPDFEAANPRYVPDLVRQLSA